MKTPLRILSAALLLLLVVGAQSLNASLFDGGCPKPPCPTGSICPQ